MTKKTKKHIHNWQEGKQTVSLEIDNFPLSEYKKFKLSEVNKPEWSRYVLNWRIGNFQIRILRILKWNNQKGG